jgi:hypothetical protein
VVALSLGGLRRRIEALMVPDSVDVVLQLDGLAERDRHRRRAQAQLAELRWTNVCTRRKRMCGPKEEVRV